MLEMPKEFGTADDLLSGLPEAMKRVDKFHTKVMLLTPGTEEFRTAGMQFVMMQQAARLDWALAAINELQIEVAMLRGDGKR